MIKYYYQDAIKALYMAREFGVKFVNPIPVKDNPVIDSNTYSNLSILLGDLEHLIKRFGKVIVYDNSIFGDGLNCNKDDYCQIAFDKLGNPYSKIMIKDNKQFFMPEVENEH